MVYIFIIALVIFYIASKIFDHFPGKDLVDISEYVGGKFLKILYSAVICIDFLTISGFVIRTFSESLVLIYFQNIDIEIVILTFIIICGIMNLFGFKTISRVALITLPAILLGIIIIFISSSSSFIPQRAFPILGYGAYDTFVSGLGNIFAFSSIIIAPFLMPQIGDRKKV